jgi:hypothetical protein
MAQSPSFSVAPVARVPFVFTTKMARYLGPIRRKLDDNDFRTYVKIFRQVISGASDVVNWAVVLKAYVEDHPDITDAHNQLVKATGHASLLTVDWPGIALGPGIAPHWVTASGLPLPPMRSVPRFPEDRHGVQDSFNDHVLVNPIVCVAQRVRVTQMIPIAQMISTAPIIPRILPTQPHSDTGNTRSHSSRNNDQSFQPTDSDSVPDSATEQYDSFVSVYGGYGQFFHTTDRDPTTSEL